MQRDAANFRGQGWDMKLFPISSFLPKVNNPPISPRRRHLPPRELLPDRPLRTWLLPHAQDGIDHHHQPPVAGLRGLSNRGGGEEGGGLRDVCGLQIYDRYRDLPALLNK